MEDNNKMIVDLTIDGEIKTKGRPRATTIGGYARVYTPKETTNYENLIKVLYHNEYGDKRFDDDVPLYVRVEAYFQIPNGMLKYKNYVDDVPFQMACLKHKDVDNIAKICIDALNKICFKDDRQITSLTVEKKWTNKNERIRILIFQDKKYITEEDVKKSILQEKKIAKINKLSTKPKLTRKEQEELEMLRKDTLNGIVF